MRQAYDYWQDQPGINGSTNARDQITCEIELSKWTIWMIREFENESFVKSIEKNSEREN